MNFSPKKLRVHVQPVHPPPSYGPDYKTLQLTEFDDFISFWASLCTFAWRDLSWASWCLPCHAGVYTAQQDGADRSTQCTVQLLILWKWVFYLFSETFNCTLYFFYHVLFATQLCKWPIDRFKTLKGVAYTLHVQKVPSLGLDDWIYFYFNHALQQKKYRIALFVRARWKESNFTMLGHYVHHFVMFTLSQAYEILSCDFLENATTHCDNKTKYFKNQEICQNM